MKITTKIERKGIFNRVLKFCRLQKDLNITIEFTGLGVKIESSHKQLLSNLSIEMNGREELLLTGHAHNWCDLQI